MRVNWNKAGSLMVESAMIFPVIFIAVICLIQILIHSYQMLEVKINCDQYARHAAGRLAATSYLKDDMFLSDGTMASHLRAGLYREILVQRTDRCGIGHMEIQDIEIKESSRYMAINESRIVRNIDLIADGIITIMDLRNKQDQEMITE